MIHQLEIRNFLVFLKFEFRRMTISMEIKRLVHNLLVIVNIFIYIDISPPPTTQLSSLKSLRPSC